MGNIFDIILLLVTVVTVSVCFAVGFFRLLKPFWKIAAFLLAWSLKGTVIVTETVGKLIDGEGVKSFLRGRVDAVWAEKIKTAAEAEGVTLTERFDDVFGFFASVITNIKEFCTGLYGETVEGTQNTGLDLTKKIEEFVTDALEYATDAVVAFITSLLGFIILYVLFMIGFWLASKALEGIFGDGILGALNKTLGGAVGIVYGFVGAWLLAIIFVIAVPRIAGVPISEVTGGVMGVTEWFYTRFFFSQLLGITL